MLKRIFDLTFAALALVALAPLLLLIAAAVKLDSPGPVLFRQIRVGYRTRPFVLLKFRSMVAAAAQTGPYFTRTDDPRVTRVGALLRRLSLDELPQLVNVLKGDMSLIGPRPDVPAQQTGYSAAQWSRRHAVKPGLTGLAQATLRSAATPEQRTALDLEYVAHRSLALDLKIFWLTLKQVFSQGSY